MDSDIRRTDAISQGPRDSKMEMIETLVISHSNTGMRGIPRDSKKGMIGL